MKNNLEFELKIENKMQKIEMKIDDRMEQFNQIRM